MVGGSMFSGVSRATIIAASFLFCSVAGAGDDRHGWYFGLEAGIGFVTDADLDGSPNSYGYDMGWAAIGTAGYRFEDPLRFEFELGFRDNSADEINSAPAVMGEVRELSGFANLLWDVSSPESRWGLNLGVGLGADNVRFKDHAGIDSREVVPAGQGIIGLTYKAGPHWEYVLNYRIVYVDQGSYETTVGLGTVTGETDFVKHTVTLGFRFGYDEPAAAAPPPAPPPPPPPPPPPAARQFIVFFGFGKANLTAEAQAVVAEAAAAAKAQGSAKILIVGHTDTVGSSDSNHQLSLRRADAVKDELTRLGISPDAITASGKGESELMVQTGDGVKEPQNRRATIDLN